MPYITNVMLELRVGATAFVQLADDDGDGVADAAVADEIRLAVEGEVNSYLAARYAVPVDLSAHSELAGLLASVCLDLAEYRLRLRRPPVAEEMLKRRAEAIDWLTNVATGVLVLPADGLPAHGIVATAVGSDRMLSHEELSNF